MSDNDNSASGYITDTFEGIGREFTDVEILNTSETNVVARAKRYGRWWLLKGLNGQVANESAYQQRLRKELELLMQLQHQYVVTAVGLEVVDGIGNCIVMEYVEGEMLKEWLQADHPRKERRRIAMEIMEAVGYIHSCGIVHRDLKPENIIITRNGGSVRLIDFGLADTDSHTVLKQPAGTLKYMSPEQMQTAVADVRNDIYSLGVVFGQMNLGYGRVVKRCLLPIERRYQHVTELMNAIRKRGTLRTVLAWAVAAMAFLVLVVVAYVQSVRVLELSKQVTTNQYDQAEIQTVVSSLSDSVEQVATAHKELKKKQQDQEDHRKRIETAITKGKAAYDKVLLASGVQHHLDTLQNLEYMNMDIFNGIQDAADAKTQYLKKISKDYTEKEMEEITNALNRYDENKVTELMNSYNKVKEAYDKAIMQGY